MNNKDDKCVLRSWLRNVGSSLIFHYFCLFLKKIIIFYTSLVASCRVNTHTFTETHVLRAYEETHRNTKWQLKFEPQVWHCDMQSAPLANLFEWLCARPDRWLRGDFLPCTWALGVPSLASSSFFIIFECHSHLRVGTRQASPTLPHALCI